MAKLSRLYHKIFGSSATFGAGGEMGKFGSLKAGLAEYAADASEIQEPAAWEGGLFDGIVGNNSPAAEDINGVLHHGSRQLGYLFEQGVPEWDDQTTYYVGGFCAYDSAIYTSATTLNLNNVVTSETAWTRVSEVNPNNITNGNFDFFQESASVAFTSDNQAQYAADQWQFLNRTSRATVAKEVLSTADMLTTGATNALKISVTTASTVSEPALNTFTEDSSKFVGKTVTLSYWAKASKAIDIKNQINMIWANGSNIAPEHTISLTTSYQRISKTFTLESAPAGTFSLATDYIYTRYFFPINDTYDVYITGVKLEEGSVATPFVLAGGNLEGELALCQRFYEVLNAGATGYIFSASAAAAMQLLIDWKFAVPKRATPTPVLLAQPSWTDPTVGSGAMTGAFTGVYNGDSKGGAFYIQSTGNSGSYTQYHTAYISNSVLAVDARW